MTNAEHIIAWIKSSRKHYDVLREIERRMKPGARDGYLRPSGAWFVANNLVYSAVDEACRDGDMYMDDVTPLSLNEAAKLVLLWELEQ